MTDIMRELAKISMTTLDHTILDVAKRREVHAKELAAALDVDLLEVRAALQRLRKAKAIYVCTKPPRNFYGSGDAGYRANKAEG